MANMKLMFPQFKLIRRINLKTRAIELEFINSEQTEKNEHARG